MVSKLRHYDDVDIDNWAAALSVVGSLLSCCKLTIGFDYTFLIDVDFLTNRFIATKRLHSKRLTIFCITKELV